MVAPRLRLLPTATRSFVPPVELAISKNKLPPFRAKVLVKVSVPMLFNPPGTNLPPLLTTTLPPMVPVPPKVVLLETVTVLVQATESPINSSVPALMVVTPV